MRRVSPTSAKTGQTWGTRRLDAEDVTLIVNVDVFSAGDFGQAGHEHHVAGDGDEESGASGKRERR